MTTRGAVDDFLAQRMIAVVGVSRGGKKFGSVAYRDLKAKGYRVFSVNPHAENIDGERGYPNLSAWREPVDGVVIVVPPAQAEPVVREAATLGNRRVWMQPAAESDAARPGRPIRFCQEQAMSVVYKHCVLRFARPVTSYHRLHRWVRKWSGKLLR